MPITIEVVDPHVTEAEIAGIFDYFASVDRMFSTYKKESEISRLNAGELTKKQLSKITKRSNINGSNKCNNSCRIY